MYCLIAFITVACGTNIKEKPNIVETKKNKPYIIDPKKFDKNNLSMSVFTDNIKYVPLSNDLNIGSIQVLKVTSNSIYLVSDNSGGGEGNGHSQLFRFSKNGKNPIQVGRIGNGPNEYLSGNFFAEDETNNRIYISGKINTILVFDTLGNYVRQFKFQNNKLKFSKLDILSSNKLLLPQSRLGAKGSKLWFVVDTLGKVISSKRNSTQPFDTHTGPYSGTYHYKDKISYWIDYNDSIFEISPNLTYKVSYIIALDELPNENLKLRSHENNFLRPPEYFLPRFFAETNKYLIIRYSYKGEYTFAFINKKTRKTYSSNYFLGNGITAGILNDYDAGLRFFPYDYYNDGENEYLCMIIHPFEIKNHVASKAFRNSTPKFQKKKKELEKLANSLNENDNPVLMLVKLKE